MSVNAPCSSSRRSWSSARNLEASGGSVLDPEPFLSWAESEPWLRRRAWVVWAARVSPALLCLLGLAQLAGLIAGPWWVVFLFVNAFVWRRAGRLAYPTLSRIEHQQAAFQQYAAGFDLLAHARFEAPRLQHLLGLLTSDGSFRVVPDALVGADHTLRDPPQRPGVLGLAADSAVGRARAGRARGVAGQQRRTGAGVARDAGRDRGAGRVRGPGACPSRLGRARDRRSRRARSRPSRRAIPCCRPTCASTTTSQLRPPGTFLLVTGSNMAGKSTLLRTIGMQHRARPGRRARVRALVAHAAADTVDEHARGRLARARRLDLPGRGATPQAGRRCGAH